MVYAAFGALAGMASTLVGLGVAAAWWSDKGASFAWGNAGMWTTIGGGIAWNVAFAAIGVGLGALIRSLVGAVALALAWIALVEGVVGQLIGNLAAGCRSTPARRWAPGARPCCRSPCSRAGAPPSSSRPTRRFSPRRP
ncbi:MAG TPA: hypothetical protein VHT26_14590 [Trebonia sp.]|nr:hypothetical protein [Trebonia sp.]